MEKVEINSIAEAYAATGTDRKAIPDVSKIQDPDLAQAVLDHFDLMILAKAKNKGKRPEWITGNQPKFVPWFGIKPTKDRPSGGFTRADCDGWRTYSDVGSRLCYLEAKEALHVGENAEFKALYERYMLYPEPTKVVKKKAQPKTSAKKKIVKKAKKKK